MKVQKRTQLGLRQHFLLGICVTMRTGSVLMQSICNCYNCHSHLGARTEAGRPSSICLSWIIRIFSHMHMYIHTNIAEAPFAWNCLLNMTNCQILVVLLLPTCLMFLTTISCSPLIKMLWCLSEGSLTTMIFDMHGGLMFSQEHTAYSI